MSAAVARRFAAPHCGGRSLPACGRITSSQCSEHTSQAVPCRSTILQRSSYEYNKRGGNWAFDATSGRPMNPVGRTGMTNRGLLGESE